MPDVEDLDYGKFLFTAHDKIALINLKFNSSQPVNCTIYFNYICFLKQQYLSGLCLYDSKFLVIGG